jgi:putative toxin-antitoxin system antitoxin component (TIGR02293 family)
MAAAPPVTALGKDPPGSATRSVLQETISLLGLKRTVRTTLDFLPAIRNGLPASTLASVAKGMALSATATGGALGLAQRTLARRLQDKQSLTAEESERVVRLARVLAEATHVLGSREKARRWLQKQSRALGETPLRLLDTDIGTNAVLQELGRIDHGVFA